MEKEVVKSMPVHESIIYAINRCESWSNADMLAFLIKLTVIPSNHDVITKSWETKMNFLRIGNQGVSSYILEQKKKAAEKKSGENLPGSFITFEEFKNLEEGSKIVDNAGVDWVVVYPNSPGSEKYPFHSLKCSLSDDVYLMFHDGKYLRYWVSEDMYECKIVKYFI